MVMKIPGNKMANIFRDETVVSRSVPLTWRIIPVSKWLITMVIVSPQDLGLWDPLQMAVSWLIHGGDPNHLQVLGWSSKYHLGVLISTTQGVGWNSPFWTHFQQRFHAEFVRWTRTCRDKKSSNTAWYVNYMWVKWSATSRFGVFIYIYMYLFKYIIYIYIHI